MLIGIIITFVNCASAQKSIGSAPTTDPRVILGSLFNQLESAGEPLTDNQQKQVKDVFISESDDFRPIFEILSNKQKTVIAENIRKIFASRDYPVSDSQFKQLSTFGSKSNVKSPFDILTPEQIQILMPKKLTGHSPERKVNIRPQMSVSTVISTLQEYLESSGIPLTDEQMKLIKKEYISSAPPNTPVIREATQEQKRMILARIRKSLTKREDILWLEILTIEQKQILMSEQID